MHKDTYEMKGKKKTVLLKFSGDVYGSILDMHQLNCLSINNLKLYFLWVKVTRERRFN